MGIKPKKAKIILRWVHIVLGLVIMCYIYSPFHRHVPFQVFVKFAVIPIIFSVSEDSLSDIPHSLTAASLALEAIAGVEPPAGAVRVRNLALMTEHAQSDMRHAFLTFAPDFGNPV